MLCKVVWVPCLLALAACGERSLPPTDGRVEDSRSTNDAEQQDLSADSTPGLCTTNEDCKVVNDCCGCGAFDKWTVFEQCLETCFVPYCTSFGFVSPRAVCIEGHCFLAEGAPNHCQSADDCVLYQDCCYCMAVPETVALPACGADCAHDSCATTGLGLDKQTGEAHFTCFQGECRLMSVD